MITILLALIFGGYALAALVVFALLRLSNPHPFEDMQFDDSVFDPLEDI